MTRLFQINPRDHMELREWFRGALEHRPEKWKSAAKPQIMFIRDDFHPLVNHSFHSRREIAPIRVAGKHTTKGVEFPVYYIPVPHRGALMMRGNYYNWQITVRAVRPVKDVFFGTKTLFDYNDERDMLKHVYFEGFEEQWVSGTYSEDAEDFSLTLPYWEPYLSVFGFLLDQAWSYDIPIVSGEDLYGGTKEDDETA